MSIRKAFYSNEEIVKLAPNSSKSNDVRDDDDSTDFQIHAVQENVKSNVPRVHDETILGVTDFKNVQNAVDNLDNKRGTYKKYTDQERFIIGRYASENGATCTVRKYKKQFPKLNESTVRSMKQKYEEELKRAVHEKREIQNVITQKKRGRPLLLGEELDTKIQSYLKAVRLRGGQITFAIALATAEALMKNSPTSELAIDLKNSYWPQSLFRRMGFKKRTATTGKVSVPANVLKEMELTYLHNIVQKIERYKIPHSMVINLDQTPTKFVPGSKRTLAKVGSTSVPVAGANDKRMITATFAVSLSGNFLPMQLIYGGKTSKSLPRVDFPDSFSLSVNVKHYSNEQESLKFFDEVIVPYLDSERKKLNLPNQYALVIMDVFKGQMTDKVISFLNDNSVLHEKVPANMTHYFQPLDLTVNGASKQFMKKKFVDWYARKVISSIDNGIPVEEIVVELKLSIMKPLHASWIISLYNHMTSSEGRSIVFNGWRRSGILDAVMKGSKELIPLDPFFDIDPMIEVPILIEPMPISQEKFVSHYIVEHDRDEDESEDEWEDEQGVVVNCINSSDEELELENYQ